MECRCIYDYGGVVKLHGRRLDLGFYPGSHGRHGFCMHMGWNGTELHTLNGWLGVFRLADPSAVLETADRAGFDAGKAPLCEDCFLGICSMAGIKLSSSDDDEDGCDEDGCDGEYEDRCDEEEEGNWDDEDDAGDDGWDEDDCDDEYDEDDGDDDEWDDDEWDDDEYDCDDEYDDYDETEDFGVIEECTVSGWIGIKGSSGHPEFFAEREGIDPDRDLVSEDEYDRLDGMYFDENDAGWEPDKGSNDGGDGNPPWCESGEIFDIFGFQNI